MKTFRITYTQASENTVEIEAKSVRDAWDLVKSGKLDDKNVKAILVNLFLSFINKSLNLI